MADKFDAILPKIVPLLKMLGSCTEGEAVNVINALRLKLTNAGLDIYALVERIEKPGFSEDEMREIYDKAYTEGRTDGVEQGRRSAVIAAAPLLGALADDVGTGINGYSWREIAQHCADNKHHLASNWEREFVESVVEKLTHYYSSPTPKMANSLRHIFLNRFAGRI